MLVAPAYASRRDVSVAAKPGYGKAAALLKAVGSPTVSLLLTYQCNLGCGHCYMTPEVRKKKPMDLDFARATIEELQGYDAVSLLGGEPSLIGMDSLIDLANFASSRVGKVVFDTNMTWLPESLEDAIALLRRFPKNTTIDGSIDPYHNDALKAIGISMKNLAYRCFFACQAAGLEFECNVRVPLGRDERGREEHAEFVANDYFEKIKFFIGVDGDKRGDFLRYYRSHKHVNGVTAQGICGKKALPGAHLVELSDVVGHLEDFTGVGVIVTPDQVLCSSDHMAFTPNPPALFTFGSLKEQTLAAAVYDQMLPGSLISSTFLEDEDKIPIDNGVFNGFKRMIGSRKRELLAEELFGVLTDRSIPIAWRLDKKREPGDKYYYDLVEVLGRFGEEAVKSVLKKMAKALADQLWEGFIFNDMYRRTFMPEFGVISGQLEAVTAYYYISGSHRYLERDMKGIFRKIKHSLPCPMWTSFEEVFLRGLVERFEFLRASQSLYDFQVSENTRPNQAVRTRATVDYKTGICLRVVRDEMEHRNRDEWDVSREDILKMIYDLKRGPRKAG